MGTTRVFLAVCLVMASVVVASCGENAQPFVPPLLMSTSGLSGQVNLDPAPVSFGNDRDGTFSATVPFNGHVFAVAGNTTVSMLLQPVDPDIWPAVAVYGPRDKQGLFGVALNFNDGGQGHEALLWDLALPKAGDYLVLVANRASNSATRYLLKLDCSLGCGAPACPALSCGLYCPAGLARDPSDSCPVCSCYSQCSSDADCPAGYGCVDSVCKKVSVCSCGGTYDPVCGKNGVTYNNLCELNCAGAVLDHIGVCTPPPCSSSSDCPAGFVCQNGTCVSACDQCNNQPDDPVCGADGLTYRNLCELQCAGVSLAHNGPCDQCGCTSDADCVLGASCVNCQCVPNYTGCRSDAECGAGKHCQVYCGNGWCSGQCLDNDPCAGVNCTGGQTCCSGACHDLASDPNNCGGCGTTCLQNESCQQGLCGPKPCTTDADCPSGDACINGQCIYPCTCVTDADCSQGQVCSNCQCQLQDPCAGVNCPTGQTCCSGVCYDLNGNTSHCGSCGTACAAGQACLNGTCSTGKCSTNSDCAGNQVCADGLCVLSCATDNDCSTSDRCINGACRTPCRLDGDCGLDQVCLNYWCAHS